MLGREIDDSSELRVDVHTPEQPISELKPEAAVALYRIAQEALQNVMKHSGASQASVTLTATERAIELVVQDAGKGFDAGNIAKRGMGLLSMQERAVLAGGSVTVRSSEGKGTVVRASIPVAPTREG
jgi:signal transduction histidine kinase